MDNTLAQIITDLNNLVQANVRLGNENAALKQELERIKAELVSKEATPTIENNPA